MIDPRAMGPKIKPPKPLPYVSRKALKRVKDWLDPPTICNVCQEESVILCNNREVYNGKQYGKWPYCYRCVACNAYVGLHPDTDLPLGTLADATTREARNASKKLFHKLTELFFKGNREAAYAWLANRMDMATNVCHFGMFDEIDALRAGEVCYTALMEGEIKPLFSINPSERRYAV